MWKYIFIKNGFKLENILNIPNLIWFITPKKLIYLSKTMKYLCWFLVKRINFIPIANVQS